MTRFSLPARLDTPAAATLKAALEQRVGEGAELELMAADIDLVGLACLQVLASARKTASLNGRSLSLAHPSATLRDACELSGFGFLLVPHEGMPA
jgi:chemotaxis protein CheX